VRLRRNQRDSKFHRTFLSSMSCRAKVAGQPRTLHGQNESVTSAGTTFPARQPSPGFNLITVFPRTASRRGLNPSSCCASTALPSHPLETNCPLERPQSIGECGWSRLQDQR
jgi:hypothetical protein